MFASRDDSTSETSDDGARVKTARPRRWCSGLDENSRLREQRSTNGDPCAARNPTRVELAASSERWLTTPTLQPPPPPPPPTPALPDGGHEGGSGFATAPSLLSPLRTSHTRDHETTRVALYAYTLRARVCAKRGWHLSLSLSHPLSRARARARFISFSLPYISEASATSIYSSGPCLSPPQHVAP